MTLEGGTVHKASGPDDEDEAGAPYADEHNYPWIPSKPVEEDETDHRSDYGG